MRWGIQARGGGQAPHKVCALLVDLQGAPFVQIQSDLCTHKLATIQSCSPSPLSSLNTGVLPLWRWAGEYMFIYIYMVRCFAFGCKPYLLSESMLTTLSRDMTVHLPAAPHLRKMKLVLWCTCSPFRDSASTMATTMNIQNAHVSFVSGLPSSTTRTARISQASASILPSFRVRPTLSIDVSTVPRTLEPTRRWRATDRCWSLAPCSTNCQRASLSQIRLQTIVC